MSQAKTRADGIIELDTRDARGAVRGRQEAREDPHRGGLARAVGAEEPHHLALLHRERDVVDREQVPVALAEPLGLDHPGLPSAARPRRQISTTVRATFSR